MTYNVPPCSSNLPTSICDFRRSNWQWPDPYCNMADAPQTFLYPSVSTFVFDPMDATPSIISLAVFPYFLPLFSFSPSVSLTLPTREKSALSHRTVLLSITIIEIISLLFPRYLCLPPPLILLYLLQQSVSDSLPALLSFLCVVHHKVSRSYISEPLQSCL